MQDFLRELGLDNQNSGVYAGGWLSPKGKALESLCPTDGKVIAAVTQGEAADYEKAVAVSQEAFLRWRMTPAPVRGDYVRRIGNMIREHKSALGKLISYEMGKILTEGEGEVQEMIDIADFAVGQSRQLYGLVMQSERAQHRMMEQWHPLGPVGIITSFNFPGAVWAWNAMVAAVCGDTMIWKPSSETPLTAVATQNLVNKVMEGSGFEGVFGLVVGGAGRALTQDKRIPLVSFTGSTAVGRGVGTAVAERFGKSILELGGNNAVIVMDDADLDMAVPSVVFGAVGTTGQRCTSTRRVFLQKGIAGAFTDRLLKAYPTIAIGDPLDSKTLVGPLVNAAAVKDYEDALATIKAQGGEILIGGKRIDRPGYFVEPTLVKAKADMDIVQHETFVPILYLIEFDTVDDAVAMHNDVPQGLSSALFTTNLRTADLFLSARGSDCGIANVNIGTSGAEIGGAFGGEKETGGGRESGSDAWKAYMRRQTNTVNWGTEMALAQGVKFEV